MPGPRRRRPGPYEDYTDDIEQYAKRQVKQCKETRNAVTLQNLQEKIVENFEILIDNVVELVHNMPTLNSVRTQEKK